MSNDVYSNELDACEGWSEKFDAIPGRIFSRAFGTDRTGLRLLAGERLRSDCCNAPVWSVNEKGTDLSHRCDICSGLCDTRWSVAGEEWPHETATVYRPRWEVDRLWLQRHATTINRTCGFLVYESDDVGALLQLPGNTLWLERFARHWLPLYQMRRLPWHRLAS